MRTFTLRAALLAATVLGGLHASAQNKTVHVDVAGTLPALLTEEEKTTLTSLTVTGSLNGTDLNVIGLMAGTPMYKQAAFSNGGKLRVIDMSGARIVAGGNPCPGDAGQTIQVEDGVVPAYLFAMTTELHTVALPATVHKIGDMAFSNSNVTTITLPLALDSIGHFAFQGCEFSSLELPASLRFIGENAFNNCWKLETLSLPDGLEEISKAAFAGANSLTELSIPHTVTKIGEEAFNGCNDLERITLPATMKEIPAGMLQYCSSLTSVNLPEEVWRIGDRAFYGTSCAVEWPSNLQVIGHEAFGSYMRESITLPESLTTIGPRAFSNSMLSAITIPASVDSIGGRAFKDSKIKTLNLSGNLTTIPAEAFAEMTLLENLVIPEGVEVIAINAFDGCSGLTGISFPATLRGIGEQAFRGCSGLTSVSLPEGLDTVGQAAFVYCYGLEEANLPSTLTKIGSQAFGGCTYLSTVRIAATVPPTIDTFTFPDNTYDNGTLYVPIGYLDAYKNDLEWRRFNNIVDEIPVGLNNVQTGNTPHGTAFSIDGQTVGENFRGIVIEQTADGQWRKVMRK